ncbi:MAG: ParB/RepB/Spo0J family partition protein [Bacteroidota bacterium]
MSKKKELGKGIRALLSNIENTSSPREKTELVKELNSSILEIPLDKIEVNPFQPRSEFDREELEELAQSIKIHGLIQAITVRNLGGDTYQLISGERRLRASRMAGLQTIPAFIRIADDQALLEMALIENIQRSNLNAIEVAISYQRLMVECDLTHESLSERVGKKRSTISNYVRLLKLPPQIQSSIKNNEISMGHARSLAGIDDVGLQLDIYKEVLQRNLSVRALENLIKSYSSENKSSVPKKKNELPAEVKKIQDSLSSTLGTSVKIKRSESGSGEINIKFKSDREFNDIMAVLDKLEN